MLGTRTVDAVIRRRAQAEALEQLIQQQMVLASLERRGEACSQQQLDLAIARFKEELVPSGKVARGLLPVAGDSVAGVRAGDALAVELGTATCRNR